MAPDEKTERFNIRLSVTELGMLNELADSMGVSASDVVRILIRKEHNERQLVSPIARRVADRFAKKK